MCGICGEIHFDARQEVDLQGMEAMATAIRHRGPDDAGFFIGAGIGLGMRRLSIIDLVGGSQPIFNEDGQCCIVFNGELYNFQDLRLRLEARGHTFRTRSDTEVILHAYEEWGTQCFCHFNGMFAFAIWDDYDHSLVIARDRIGEKPLYYYQDADRLVFASEIKGILANPSIPRQINLHGLANFLSFGHAVAPDTMYQGIRKLLPGHYLIVKSGHVTLRQYWDVGDEPQLPVGTELTELAYADHILTLLDDSVRRRMLADVPVGAFLSGGVDSSATVALMQRHATGPVKTFSLGFSNLGAYNELSEARQVAKALGTEHYELEVQHVDLVQTLRTLVYHYDEPFGDAAGFPIYLLSRFAREHVKVVLTGDGGDELFGGYRRYAIDQLASLYQRLPRSLIEHTLPGIVEQLPRLQRVKRLSQAWPITDPVRRYANWLLLFTPDMQVELLQPQILAALGQYDPIGPYHQYYHQLNQHTANDHLNRMMYMDVKTWLADTYMEKTDKATMACSLEGRLPILDHRLVELAFQIPGRYKIKGWSTKRIFKRAVSSIIPTEILRRPKRGFSVPIDPWFRNDLKSFAFDVLLDNRTRGRGYFNSEVVERLWHEHVRGRHVWDAQLWVLLNFELWHRIFLDGEGV